MRKHVLAVSVLLLGLTVHAAAQNRSPEEALKGISGFGVSVKYGTVDGLPKEMRGPVLTELHNRARNLLMQADMPLLQATDETELAGKMRLLFIVTVNKETGHSMPVQVETGLTERVRLRRDDSKEMELVTWGQYGVGGPNASTKMVFDVFDGQVTGFIKDYKRANAKPGEAATSTTNASMQIKENANSLQGLAGVRFHTPIREEMGADPQRAAALQQLINAEVEKKLKEAGIPLLKYTTESEAAGNPILTLWLKLSGPNYYAPAIEIETKLWQQVRPVRDLKKDIQAVTWESLTIDAGPITNEAVIQALNRQVDEFIKAYNAANPKVSAVRQ
jgi:hypothetical protein